MSQRILYYHLVKKSAPHTDQVLDDRSCQKGVYYPERLIRLKYYTLYTLAPDTPLSLGLIGWIGMMYSLASADRDNKEKKRRIIYKEGLQAFGMDNACAMLTIYWATSKLLFSFCILLSLLI